MTIVSEICFLIYVGFKLILITKNNMVDTIKGMFKDKLFWKICLGLLVLFVAISIIETLFPNSIVQTGQPVTPTYQTSNSDGWREIVTLFGLILGLIIWLWEKLWPAIVVVGGIWFLESLMYRSARRAVADELDFRKKLTDDEEEDDEDY